MPSIRLRQEVTYKAVARVLQNGTLTALAVFNYSARHIFIVSIRDTMLTGERLEAMNDLPVWGSTHRGIILLAKEGTRYWVYFNGELHVGTVEEIISLTKRGFTPLDFCVVTPSNKAPYLKPKRGSLYEYAQATINNGIWVVNINSVLDCEDFNTMQIFHNLSNAQRYFQQEVRSAKTTANGKRWTEEEADTLGGGEQEFSVWDDGDYVSNHIQIRLSCVQFSD